jgi:hypothetical protein
MTEHIDPLEGPALGADEWFVDWWNQQRSSPWRVQVSIDVPIREGGNVAVAVFPDSEKLRGPAHAGGQQGLGVPGRHVWFISERPASDVAAVLRADLASLRRLGGLEVEDGVALLFLLFAIGLSHDCALRHAEDPLHRAAKEAARGGAGRGPSRPLSGVDALLTMWEACRGTALDAANKPRAAGLHHLSFSSIPPVYLATKRPGLGGSKGILPLLIQDVLRTNMERRFGPLMQHLHPRGDFASLVGDEVGADSDEKRVTPDTQRAYGNDERIFQKRGKTWFLVYGGIPKSVRDSKGMMYICHLLQDPGQEIYCFRLLADVAGEDAALHLGAAGPKLDKQAIREYQERISEIDGDLTKAEADHDLARVERLSKEREELYMEISGAMGLRGKERVTASDRENIRKAVSVAIHRAVRAIEKEHGPLGQHLGNSLKIGEYLSYRPDLPASWTT